MRHNIKIYEDMNTDDPRRFYPEYFPISLNEPLKTNFVILESPEEIRKGLMSLVSFEEGDLIAQCVGVALNFQTLHSLERTAGQYLHDPFWAGYIIHSCSPNSYLNMKDFTLHALKKISSFSLITIDYEITEKNLYQGFTCTCGSPNCKGWIEGREYRESISNQDATGDTIEKNNKDI